MPASLQAELKAVSSEEEISMNRLITLAVAEKLAARRAHKQFASGDLAARQAKLANRSRPQLRADLDALMRKRASETSIEGDELMGESA